jgi:hypothetical protein
LFTEIAVNNDMLIEAAKFAILAIEKLPSLFSVLLTEESMIMLEHYEHFRKLSQNIRNTSKLTSRGDKFIFSSKNGTRL